MSNQSDTVLGQRTAPETCNFPAMGWDLQRQTEIKNELEHEFSIMLESAGVHSRSSEIVAKELLKIIAEIAPPERADHFVGFTAASLYIDENERKNKQAGSIRLSLNQLFDALASSLPLSPRLTEPVEPWALVAATMALWSSVRGITRTYESDSIIGVFWTLWDLSDAAGVIDRPLQDILLATNNRLMECGRNKVDLAELESALDYLQYIRIVCPSKYGGLYIVKWVRVQYF